MNNHETNYTLIEGMAQWLATYSDSAALSRVCQPLPSCLKYSIISASNLTVTCCFGLSNGGRPFTVNVPSFCALVKSATNLGSNSFAGRIFSSISSVNSVPSSSACRVIILSSTSLGIIVLGLSVGIMCYLAFIGFSQADRTDDTITDGIGQMVKPQANIADGAFSNFAVIEAVINPSDSRFKLKVRNRIKPDAVFQLIALVFVVIKLDIHYLYCNYKKAVNQTNKAQQVPTRDKKHLTRERFSSSIKSLTKTTSGLSQPSFMRFFCAYLMAFTRLYDGLRELNKIPLGNKLRRLVAVSEARHLDLFEVAKSKLKPQGGQNYA